MARPLFPAKRLNGLGLLVQWVGRFRLESKGGFRTFGRLDPLRSGSDGLRVPDLRRDPPVRK